MGKSSEISCISYWLLATGYWLLVPPPSRSLQLGVFPNNLFTPTAANRTVSFTSSP